MVGAGGVGPGLEVVPLVAAELEQVAEDCVDLQREVTCFDVTEKSSVTFFRPSCISSLTLIGAV